MKNKHFLPIFKKNGSRPQMSFFSERGFSRDKNKPTKMEMKISLRVFIWSFLSVKNNCHFESFYGIFSRLKNKYQLRVFIGSFLSVKNNYLSNSTLKKEDIFWKKVWKKTTRYN